jgi:cytochrome c-type biogenesis protein
MDGVRLEEQFTTNVSLLGAFIAGLISFLSPCVLPLIPGYISFISGASLKELTGPETIKEARKKAVINSLFFVLGFSVVFISLGASATAIGKFLVIYKKPLSIAAGIIIIILGLHMTGLIKIPALYSEKRIHINTKPLNFAGAFIVGVAFAFGWTPCIGPILAGILTVAAAQDTVWRGIMLLSMYSLGLAIPFMITAYSITFFFKMFDKIKKSLNIIEWIAGALLIIVGVLILTGGMTIVASWFGSLGS